VIFLKRFIGYLKACVTILDIRRRPFGSES
jgi:hypothetical protein